MPETQAGGGLWVILRDTAGEIDKQHAEDGEDAIKVAIIMLSHLELLKDGDLSNHPIAAAAPVVDTYQLI
jgi:hypothetical protein